MNKNEIQAGISAIDKLLDSCKHGIPLLAPEMEEMGSIQALRNDKGGKFSSEQFEKAYAESHPVLEVEGLEDSGYTALVDFFSFLKSLRATLTLLQKGCFAIFARRKWEKTSEKAQDVCETFTEMPKNGIKVGEKFVLFLKIE